MITFKAQYIDSTNIIKIADNKNKNAHKVSFIELDAKDPSDLNAIRKVARSWDKYSYASDIYNHALSAHLWNEDTGQAFFALTEQRNNFEKANPFDILGICEIRKRFGTNYYLNYIQTDPEFMFEPLRFGEATYKNIGKALIKKVLDYFPKKNLVLHATSSSIDFYKKIGGIVINPDSKYILLKNGLLNKIV